MAREVDMIRICGDCVHFMEDEKYADSPDEGGYLCPVSSLDFNDTFETVAFGVVVVRENTNADNCTEYEEKNSNDND